jgi:2-succinyl-6-hydroxy-2,4-cyclohexadiene-1-carboxylate synthase
MSRVVLLHGFTQTGASWDRIAPVLATDHDVRCPDIAGHGTNADVRVNLWESAGAVADREGRAAYLGYSMGGRLALHIALARPEAVTALVLVSATAGIDSADERAKRRGDDAALADRIEEIGAGAFLDEWLAQPMFAGLPADARAGRSSDASGLASSLRLAGTGSQDPLWERLVEIEKPALVIAGANDQKYVALGERLAATLPEGELIVMPSAGHAVPWEVPDDFVTVVRPWLKQYAA